MDDADGYRITGIEFLQFEGRGDTDRYGVLRLCAGGRCGYARCELPGRGHRFDIVGWSSFLLDFRRPAIGEARLIADARRACWGSVKAELVIEACRDLSRRIRGDREALPEPVLALDECQSYFEVL
ncbi:hypothetical protein [Cohnella sp. GCM10027633]|uniref:hypothetical protein n=1 Tax=unclassified Cohnella TaxID=2636738 RepID=UPI003625DF70